MHYYLIYRRLKNLTIKLLLSLFFGLFFFQKSSAQIPVSLKDEIKQHIFSFNEIECLEDANSQYSIRQITGNELSKKFKPSNIYTPKNNHLQSSYWYRIHISKNVQTRNDWILEFFDQTIDHITVYSPIAPNQFSVQQLGDNYPFKSRFYHHKNFIVKLENKISFDRIYYIRIKSHQPANVIIVLKSVSWFVDYALDEYFFFGIFYGMILVFSLYNLIMYFVIGQRHYLFYILYNLSIGLYEMCADGIAYQYLWPNAPHWNQFAYGIPLYTASVFALLFTQTFLHVKTKAPVLNKVILGVIGLRSAFFLFSLIFDHDLFSYKIIEIIPLGLAFYTGCTILKKGYYPARFFVVGYSFLLVGFIIKSLILFDVSWLPFGPVTHYSLSFCFVMEMLLVSFAIADKVRHLKNKKNNAQKRIIEQLSYNEELKSNLNKELETKVAQRTREIVAQSATISLQNDELTAVNELLRHQTEEISRMNALLEQNNQNLQTDIEKVTKARVMSSEVDFEEFSKIYPDQEVCLAYLAELKWANGYVCKKCSNTRFSNGSAPHSRRCTKCRYEESVIANTIFQNTHLPITKAFYMLFLTYSTKGKVSSYKLSEMLSIRQSTCWAFSSRVKKVMEDRKKELRKAGEKGWSKLVLEEDFIPVKEVV
ncbi:MAG: chromosome partitioning protein ParA [Sphingobacteriaceae bacterium]|nr:MAG: chromosome partitioning protein ParA [Sphingobacteriaceae bacterium]